VVGLSCATWVRRRSQPDSVAAHVCDNCAHAVAGVVCSNWNEGSSRGRGCQGCRPAVMDLAWASQY